MKTFNFGYYLKGDSFSRKHYFNNSFKCALCTMLVMFWYTIANADSNLQYDITNLSLEELMNIEVTSVAKRSQRLGDSAAAIFVITQDDIRRSGATSIPEVLRLAPGVHVSRLEANIWTISVRGFNDRFSNKLLVLMDGRSVYTPLFSGVFWDRQDTNLDDIERIEIIRGPGASLWGANAVNGVINIITKKAENTTGGMVTAGLGTEDKAIVTARYGGNFKDKGAYRIYLKSRDIDPLVDSTGKDRADDLSSAQGGFRFEWNPDYQNELTVQGDIYKQTGDQIKTIQQLTPPYSVTNISEYKGSGSNLLARWTKMDQSGEGWILQAYYDNTEASKAQDFTWNVDVFDLDFQNNFNFGSNQKWTWGLGFRHNRTETKGSDNYFFEPENSNINILSAFVQNEISLAEDRLLVTLGSKFEYNEGTDFDIQPSARLLWKFNDKKSIWTAVSRAVRTPSRGEFDGIVNQVQPQPPFPPVLIQLNGNKDLDSEELIAFEIGYREAISESVSMDLAGFANFYDNLLIIPEPTGPYSLQFMPTPHILAVSDIINDMKGEVYGLEVDFNWNVTKNWKLRGAYTFTEMFLHAKTNQPLVSGEEVEGNTPRNIFSLRSQMDISNNIDLDIWLRYVDNLTTPNVQSYTTADARISWRPLSNLELSLVGQNLFDSQHQEFSQQFILATDKSEVERAVYGKIVWRF